MTLDPPNDPASAPADELPIVKIGLDPDSPYTLTDVTSDVGDIRFDTGYSSGFRILQQARNVTGRQRDPVPVSILDEATMFLDEVRPGESRTALRHAALAGTRVQLEFYSDGDRVGAVKISAQCFVTRTSIRARRDRERFRRRRPRGTGGGSNDILRDDDFELNFMSGATFELIEQCS